MFICVCNHEPYGNYSPVKSQCIYIAINRQECQYNNYNTAITSITHYARVCTSLIRHVCVQTSMSVDEESLINSSFFLPTIDSAAFPVNPVVFLNGMLHYG